VQPSRHLCLGHSRFTLSHSMDRSAYVCHACDERYWAWSRTHEGPRPEMPRPATQRCTACGSPTCDECSVICEDHGVVCAECKRLVWDRDRYVYICRLRKHETEAEGVAA
jgi:hypothetical protein